MKRWVLPVFPVAAAGVALLLGTGVADANFNGSNGLIAFDSHEARSTFLQLGFIRGDSVWLASPTGTHAHAVVPKKAPYRYVEPAWSRTGDLAVTRYEDTESHGYSEVAVIRPRRRRLYVGPGT